MLTQYYRPEPNFITADVSQALSEEVDVTVVCARPNYPLGRYYDGWRGWLPRRSREGAVTVWRLPVLAYNGTSIGRRALCYGSFLFGAAVLAPFAVGRPDVVWVYQTPFTTALAAMGARYLAGARLVYTAADLWPESMLAARVVRPGLLARALYAYSRWINRHAHLIVASTAGILERYARDGVPRDRLRHVPVWVDAAPDIAGGSSHRRTRHVADCLCRKPRPRPATRHDRSRRRVVAGTGDPHRDAPLWFGQR